MGDPYGKDDPRSFPDRGVRIKPLPVFMHKPYRRLLTTIADLCRSHISTWKLADRLTLGDPLVSANLIYWESCLKFLSHLEYLGTSNDPSRNRSTPPRPADRDHRIEG